MDHLFSSKISGSTIDLTMGAPSTEVLSKLPRMFAAATHARMEQEAGTGNLFQYGPEQGILSFRRNLAQFLSAKYSDHVDEDELIVTTGATNGLSLTCSVLLDRNAVVFVENPTYFIALKLLSADHGFRIVPVPLNKDGIDTEQLEKLVKKEKEKAPIPEQGRFWSMLYTIPNFHNPTGITFKPETCQQIVRISRENEMLVMCDDVYNLLVYGDKPQFSRLKSFDRDGFVISNGTFSKILAPGVRLGWLEVPARLVPRFTKSGIFQSAGAQNNYTAGIVSTLLQNGAIEEHIGYVRDLYKERMDTMYEYLKEHLPENWTVEHPGGGCFLWIQADTDLTGFLPMLKSSGVVVLSGPQASPYTFLGREQEDTLSNCMRLAVSFHPIHLLMEACRILCEQANLFIR